MAALAFDGGLRCALNGPVAQFALQGLAMGFSADRVANVPPCRQSQHYHIEMGCGTIIL
jgi:thiamine biosynthesis lipoprotein ApbE